MGDLRHHLLELELLERRALLVVTALADLRGGLHEADGKPVPTHLFGNISLVVEFSQKFPMPGGGGIE